MGRHGSEKRRAKRALGYFSPVSPVAHPAVSRSACVLRSVVVAPSPRLSGQTRRLAVAKNGMLATIRRRRLELEMVYLVFTGTRATLNVSAQTDFSQGRTLKAACGVGFIYYQRSTSSRRANEDSVLVEFISTVFGRFGGVCSVL